MSLVTRAVEVPGPCLQDAVLGEEDFKTKYNNNEKSNVSSSADVDIENDLGPIIIAETEDANLVSSSLLNLLALITADSI